MKKQFICMLCDRERRHGLEHDAWCPCETCQHERAADTALEPRR